MTSKRQQRKAQTAAFVAEFFGKQGGTLVAPESVEDIRAERDRINAELTARWRAKLAAKAAQE